MKTSQAVSVKTLLALVLPVAVLLGALLVCRFAGVTLGEGSFRYLYSPYGELKLVMILAAAPGLAMLGLAIRRAGAESATRLGTPRLGTAAALLTTIGALWLGIWCLAAMPRPLGQHYLNFTSPSHDGAFILETPKIPSAAAYIRMFPETQKRTIDDMLGTRVLSNPPGMTALAFGIRSTWPRGMIEEYFSRVAETEQSFYVDLAALGLKLAAVCTALWLLSIVPIYLAARRLLPPTSALAAAILTVFAPAGMDFTPGKDAAQIFLAGWQLFGALLACQGRVDHPHPNARPLLGGLVLGAATALGVFFGLILAWTALPPLIFAAWRLRREMNNIMLLVGGAIAGAIVMGGAIYLAVGYNLVTGSISVARTWQLVQPQIKLSRSIWMLIGLPIALLFMPPVLLSAPLLRRGITRRATFALLLATLLTLTATYLLGIPYELPRLWLAFLPTLVLGAFLIVGPFHADRQRVVILATALTVVSLVAASVHRAQLDPRESETRLAKEDPLN